MFTWKNFGWVVEFFMKWKIIHSLQCLLDELQCCIYQKMIEMLYSINIIHIGVSVCQVSSISNALSLHTTIFISERNLAAINKCLRCLCEALDSSKTKRVYSARVFGVCVRPMYESTKFRFLCTLISQEVQISASTIWSSTSI